MVRLLLARIRPDLVGRPLEDIPDLRGATTWCCPSTWWCGSRPCPRQSRLPHRRCMRGLRTNPRVHARHDSHSALHGASHDAGDELPAGEDEKDDERDRRSDHSGHDQRQVLEEGAWSSCTATGRVGLLGPSTMNGQKKFVHEATNVKRASMVAAGRAAGAPRTRTP